MTKKQVLPKKIPNLDERRALAKNIFARLKKDNPNPTTELHYSSPFTLLVAVVLSAQTTDVAVNKATAELFKVAQTPQQMLALGEEKLKHYIRTIGLFNAKAKNVIKLSQQLIDHHGGEVPRQRDALQSLAGVGRKTANVVLNTLEHQPLIAVDTHVHRLAHRLNLSRGETPDAVEEDLMKVVSSDDVAHAHHWLILHGRYVCQAKSPRCAKCVLHDLCPYPHKTSDQGELL